MSQLANSQSERPKGTFPSQPLTIRRNSYQAHVVEDQQLNQCNVIHTLRSSKKVDNQVSIPPNPIHYNQTQAPPFLASLHPNLTSPKKISQPIRCTSL